jgi:DNA-binding MarR family transcriptional regulator
MPRPTPDLADCNCLSLRRAARAITAYYDVCLAPAGLRVTQFGMLMALAQSNAMSVNRLAEALELDRTTTGKNLQPLIRDGSVDFAASPVDARVREARLTKSGRALVRHAQKLWQQAQAELERANGQRAMARLRQNLAGLVLPPAAKRRNAVR